MAIAARLGKLRGELAHPKDLLSDADFQKGVKYLLADKLTPGVTGEPARLLCAIACAAGGQDGWILSWEAIST